MATDRFILSANAAEPVTSKPFSPATIARRLRAEVLALHNDEDGLSTVEMLLLLAVGVIILLAVVGFIFPQAWTRIKQWINNLLVLQP
jgi:hypothetical protein